MEAEKTYLNKVPRTIQQKRGGERTLDFAVPVQRLGDDEDEALQGKFENAVQRQDDDEEPLQGQFEQPVQKNETRMPDNLKAGIEKLSGFSLDKVRVHYNSDKPATVQARAYARGTDIHLAPGQERDLPHEAWHVVQQMEGRVEPTTEIDGVPVNDNADLEHEADVMGARALEIYPESVQADGKSKVRNFDSHTFNAGRNTVQRVMTKADCNSADDVNAACDKFEEYLEIRLSGDSSKKKDGYLTILNSIRQVGGGLLVWATERERNRHRFMFATDNDQVKGIIGLVIDDHVHIENVVGIEGGGAFLVNESKKYAIAHNMDKVTLVAADDALVGYYKRLEFESDDGDKGHFMTWTQNGL